MKLSNEQAVLNLLLKDRTVNHNSLTLSKIIGISHAGTFKILKRLEKNDIVNTRRIGNTVVYSLNIDNPVTVKLLETILTIEAQISKRWIEEFKPVKDKSLFVILFGSILNNEKSARDIDILIVSDKKRFNDIKSIIEDKNNISNKKIHLILQTLKEFNQDYLKNNKVILDILKRGIVLFGQNKFVEVIK
ncbi:MAG: winged helix-turn-helix domain-containing protein [Nanoarchaeota archaeon]|nr:winged helix-turn-helix domain-containing protein [Nanoarchaeota archaeon]